MIHRFAILLLLTAACEPIGPEGATGTELRFPAALTVDPSGRYAYVLNTNFDSRFAGGTLLAVDLEEGRIVTSSAVETYSYGGRVIGRPDGAGGFDRLYFTTREGSTLTWAEVTPSADGPVIHCTDVGADPGRLPRCGGRFVIGGNGAEINAGADPFAVAFSPSQDGGPEHLLTTSFGGHLGLFRLSGDGEPSFVSLTGVSAGLYDVAVHPTVGTAYTSSKFRNTAAAITVHDDGPSDPAPFISVTDAFVVSSPLFGAEFGRAMAFNGTGDLLYLAYRGPPAGVVVADTRPGPTGQPRNAVLGIVALPASASGMAVQPTANGDLLYVSLFARDQIAVVDPSTLAMVDLIDVGDGPFDVAFTVTSGKPRLVFTLFNERAIGVVDLDPDSPTFRREVRRIGR